jgi:hypothetical protein
VVKKEGGRGGGHIYMIVLAPLGVIASTLGIYGMKVHKYIIIVGSLDNGSGNGIISICNYYELFVLSLKIPKNVFLNYTSNFPFIFYFIL